jgi:hypothetical protein
MTGDLTYGAGPKYEPKKCLSRNITDIYFSAANCELKAVMLLRRKDQIEFGSLENSEKRSAARESVTASFQDRAGSVNRLRSAPSGFRRVRLNRLGCGMQTPKTRHSSVLGQLLDRRGGK